MSFWKDVWEAYKKNLKKDLHLDKHENEKNRYFRDKNKKVVQEYKDNHKRRFTGSWGWIIFWIFVFWPIAIVYFFLNYKEMRHYKRK